MQKYCLKEVHYHQTVSFIPYQLLLSTFPIKTMRCNQPSVLFLMCKEKFEYRALSNENKIFLPVLGIV